MDSKIIAQGAEAILIKKGSSLTKQRVKKSYRLNILDEKLRKQRTRKEYALLQKAFFRAQGISNKIQSRRHSITGLPLLWRGQTT
jgi:tRNA A-37 threonylcarbamoyl transferase component Bud32